MCFYIYSPQGEIDVDVTETVYFHPRFFTEFGGSKYKGRTTLLITIFVTSKTENIDDIRIIYPNITEYFVELSKNKEAWSWFRGKWDDNTTEVPHNIRRSFSDDVYHEVLKRIPTEIHTITFGKPLNSGVKVPILLEIGSPNAIENNNTLDSADISFNIGGPDNVIRTFESGLEGAEETFQTNMENNTDPDERAADSAALDTVRILKNNLLNEIPNHKSNINSWRAILIFDPRLTNIKISSNGVRDLSAFGAPEAEWHFELPLYRRLNPFGNNVPETRSFIYKGDGEAKFEIRGAAVMHKPTMYLITFAAFILAFISLFF